MIPVVNNRCVQDDLFGLGAKYEDAVIICIGRLRLT